MVASSLNHPVDLNGWHHHFAHAGVRSIRMLTQKQIVNGLTILGEMKIRGICKDCVYGKHTARPYDGEIQVKQHANTCTHIDLWGPATVTSLGGASYLMLVADDRMARLSDFFLS